MPFHIHPYSLAIVHSENSSYRDNLEQTYIPLTDQPDRAWLPKSAYLDSALIQANIAGLALRSVMGFEVYWDGGEKPESLGVEIFEAPQSSFMEGYQRVFSRLGKGIFQLTIKAIIRSPRDVNLLVMKPINFIEFGYEVIPALIETDTYTNEISFAFRVTIPHKRIYIELGSVLASLIPLPRYFVDSRQLKICPKNATSQAHQQPIQEQTAHSFETNDKSYRLVQTARTMGWSFLGQEMVFVSREIFPKIPKLGEKEIQLVCSKKLHKYIYACIKDTRAQPVIREDLPQELSTSVPVAMACSHSIDILAPFSFAVTCQDKQDEPLRIELDLDDPLSEENILTIINNFESGIFSCVFSFSMFTHKSSRLLITSPLSGAIKGLTTLSRIIDSHVNSEQLTVHMKSACLLKNLSPSKKAKYWQAVFLFLPSMCLILHHIFIMMCSMRLKKYAYKNKSKNTKKPKPIDCNSLLTLMGITPLVVYKIL